MEASLAFKRTAVLVVPTVLVTFILLTTLLVEPIIAAVMPNTIAEQSKKATQRRIAVIEDDPVWAEITMSLFTGSAVAHFFSCEQLLVALADPAVQFDLYVLDNDLGSGLMRGPACVVQIKASRPAAIIVGFSGGSEDPGFVNAGGAGWISKTGNIKLLKTFLP